MTDKPTPTDAEILDAAEDFRSHYTHGGTTFDEFDEIGFTRAVLAKWGQPAQQAPAGESLRTEALCDLSYSHGLKAGWNYCASDDLAGFERAQKIGTEALRTLKSPTAQQAPAGATAWHSVVLDLIDECPGLTMEQDHWLSRRVKELDLAPSSTAQQASAHVLHVLHLVQDAFAEVAMAYPKAFALHKVGLADTAVRKALAAMRAFADATHALRASPGQAPAQPDQPITCSYGDNGYACCEGGPCQADVHNDKLAEQQAPATAQSADSVQEDAARYRWLREGNDAKHGAAWHVAVNLYGCEWDAAIDAARKQGGV